MILIPIETFRIELKGSTWARRTVYICLNGFEKQIELDQCRLNYVYFRRITSQLVQS